MSFTIITEAFEALAVQYICPEGSFTCDSDGPYELRDTLQAVKAGTNVILDVAHMQEIDGRGFNQLMNGLKSVSENGGQIGLAGLPQKQPDEFFQRMNFATIVDGLNDSAVALAPLRTRRPNTPCYGRLPFPRLLPYDA
jgi:anti-anti-sigma regulatory factor